MLAFMISPERGSLTLGPYAFSIVDGSQRIVDRRDLGRDRIAESGRAEHGLPHLDALDQPGHPFGGRRRIDIPDDWLDGVGDGGVRILWLEPEALDETTPRARYEIFVVIFKRQ